MFGKLILLSAVLEIIILIIVAFSMYSFKLNEKKHNLSELEIVILESSKLRLEMLVRRDSNFTNLYKLNYNKIKRNLKLYDSISNSLNDIYNINQLDSLKTEYQNNLSKYYYQIELFGLNEDDGIEGNFRKKVHRIEEILKEVNNQQVYLLLLQSRRREKDYIIRGRYEYVEQVNDLISKIKKEITKSNISKNKRDTIIDYTDAYSKAFNDYVLITKSMSSLEKEMFNLEKVMKNLILTIINSENSTINAFQATLIPLFIFSIMISVILSIIISKSITKPIVHLKHATIKLANGDFNIKVKIESEDEIGDLANFFNYMTENISNANNTIMNQQIKLNKQFNDLKEVNATRDKFFSIIAHDLKNPISAFMGVSNFLVKRFQDLSKDEIKDFIDEVNSSAKQLYELLENLLLWSKSQRGLINYHPMELNLKSLILHNVELLKMNADNKKILLNYSIGDNVKIFADPNMINTIIRNLTTNAIKFTYENGKVEIKSEIKDSFVVISVKDTGVGIDDENLGKLFKLENSVSTLGTEHETGTGLGLILCKEFVEQHGGKIWVESRLNEGSTFFFTIPIKSDN